MQHGEFSSHSTVGFRVLGIDLEGTLTRFLKKTKMTLSALGLSLRADDYIDKMPQKTHLEGIS